MKKIIFLALLLLTLTNCKIQSQSFIYVDCDSKTHAVCHNLKILVWAAAGMMGSKNINSFTPILVAGASKNGRDLSFVGIFESADIIKFNLKIYKDKGLKKYFIPCHQYKKFFINFMASDTAGHDIGVNTIIYTDGIGLIFLPSGEAYGFKPQKNDLIKSGSDLEALLDYGFKQSLLNKKEKGEKRNESITPNSRHHR